MIDKNMGKIPINTIFLRTVLVYSVIILSTLSVYLPVKNFDFINYDDDDDMYVFQNTRVLGGLSSKNILWSLTAMKASNWHPLTWISHMTDIQIFGLNAGGHHLTSVGFHILNTVLLLVWLNTMTGEFWKSSFVAALFALHPLHVESVAWIAERKDVLCTFFCFLALLSYTRYCQKKNRQQYLLSLFFFICALMAKPMAVTLPFVFFILDYWPLKRFPKVFSTIPVHDKRILGHLLVEKIPFLMFSFLSCWITLTAQHSTVVSTETFPLIPRIANSLISYTEYLAKMVCPLPLAVLYPHPRMFSLWKFIASLFIFLSISLLSIQKIRRRPWLAVGWFWYLGTLIPVIGLVQVGFQGYADRYTYIPLIGLFIMIAWQVPEMAQSWRHRTFTLSVCAAGILSVLWVLTSFQIRHWENNITLFEHALKATSENFVVHNNLGVSLAQKGNYNEAIAHCRQAIRIFPGYNDVYNNFGWISLMQENYQEAIFHYQNAIANNPNSAQSYYFLANLYFGLNQIDNAIVNFAKALKIRPDHVDAMTNLAISLALIGKADESLALFKEAKRIDPDFAAARRINIEKIFREKMD
ncbi:MAG: tetratricopeptide repeat protein [Pseudomonadota bacterium]